MFQIVPGPPFVFGALLVICALLVAAFIPVSTTIGSVTELGPLGGPTPLDTHYELERGQKVAGTLSPLISSHIDPAVL